MKPTSQSRVGPEPLGMPQASRRVLWVAFVVMATTFLAMTLDRRKSRTGVLLVQCSDPGTSVEIRQGERVLITATDRRSFSLLPGEYQVVLVDPRTGAESSQRIKVERGGHSIVGKSILPAPKSE